MVDLSEFKKSQNQFSRVKCVNYEIIILNGFNNTIFTYTVTRTSYIDASRSAFIVIILIHDQFRFHR
jgi:hypothetical protein